MYDKTENNTLQHAQARHTLYLHAIHTCQDERDPWMHFSGIMLLQCCSGRRSSDSEHSNQQQLSVDEDN